jgi:hypothetical protein
VWPFGYFTRRRRQKVRRRPFPEAWADVLRANLPFYERLSEAERAELHGHVQVFLDEKRFQGYRGLEITDEVRLTIAGQACLLLLGGPGDYFKHLRSIHVYPGEAYTGRQPRRDGPAVVDEPQARLGESWYRGPVVLSWDAVRRGAADPRDGRNVVLHEFAHQLDGEATGMDGAPRLHASGMYAAWARVLGREYKELVEKVAEHRPAVLDEYAATAPPEFFAVVTEAFFEKARSLRRKHPELYEQLKQFYRQDPAEWPRKQ